MALRKASFSILLIGLLSSSFAEDASFFSNQDNRIRLFLKLTDINGDYEFSERFYDSLLETTDSQTDLFFGHLGLAWYYRNNKSEETTREIIEAKTLLSRNEDLWKYEGYMYITEAKVYRHFGQLEKSLRLLHLGLADFKETDELAMYMITKAQLSLTNAESDLLAESLESLSEIIEKSKELKDGLLKEQIILYIYNQYSTVLTIMSARGLDSQNLASPILELVIKKAEELNQGYIISNAKGNLAYVYTQEGKYEKALELARIDLSYSLKAERVASTAHLYYLMAKIFFGMDQMDSASFYLSKTEEMIGYFSEPLLIKEFADLSLDYYKKIGNLDKAYASMTNQLNLLNDLYLDKSKTDFDLIKAQTDLENAEQDLEALQLRNVIQNRMAILLIVLLIVVTLLLAYIIRQSALQKMQNKQLELLNNSLEEEVQKRTQKIVEQNLKIKEIAFRNSHQTRAPVARLLGMVELLKIENTENQNEIYDKIKDSAREIDAVIHEVNTILNDPDPRE